MKAPVVIGSRYTGQHVIVHNQATGEYSECRPVIQGHMLVLQKCLDAHAKRERAKAAKTQKQRDEQIAWDTA